MTSLMALQENNIEQLIENVLGEINDQLGKEIRPFPSELDVGDRGSISISCDAEERIAELAQAVLEEYYHEQRGDFAIPDWSRIFRSSFGKSVEWYLSDDANHIDIYDTEEFMSVLREKIKDQINGMSERINIFGCHLFDIPESDIARIKPLQIGSVSFEPRRRWLNRMSEEKHMSETARRRIISKWEGGRIRKRKSSWDYMKENAILDVVGSCKFVCIVSTGKMGEKAGFRKSLLAARIATTVVAIAYTDSTSSVLDSMGLIYDQNLYQKHNLALLPSGKLGLSSSISSLQGYCPQVNRKIWEELTSNIDGPFRSAGEVCNYITGSSDSGSRDKLLHVLFQAIYWFHEGCREGEDTMAITKFCAALESLSCGGSERGIQQLVRSRLEIDGPELNSKIQKIYRQGRSETLHGNNRRLFHDWAEDRSVAENLARGCLHRCLEYATKHPDVDNPGCFRRS